MIQKSISQQDLLKRFQAFSLLEPEHLEWLAERVKLYHCNVGQELLVSDRLPEQCFCILEGTGRLLHQDPGLQRPVTLALSRPGDLVGWIGLRRRVACEWVAASTEMKLLGFQAKDFYWLEENSKSFALRA